MSAIASSSSSTSTSLPAATSDKKRKRSRGGANKNKSTSSQNRPEPESIPSESLAPISEPIQEQIKPSESKSHPKAQVAPLPKVNPQEGSDSDSDGEGEGEGEPKDGETKSGGRKRVRKRKSKKKAALTKALEEEKKAMEPLGEDPPKEEEIGPDPVEDERLSETARNALIYARQYLLSRPTWKFHKARQNWLLRHVLNVPPPFEAVVAVDEVTSTSNSKVEKKKEEKKVEVEEAEKEIKTTQEGKEAVKTGEGGQTEEEEKEKEEMGYVPIEYVRLVGWYLRGIQGGAKDRLLSSLYSNYRQVPIQEPEPSVPPPSYYNNPNSTGPGLGDMAMEIEKEVEEEDKVKEQMERERRKKWFGKVIWSMGEKLDEE